MCGKCSKLTAEAHKKVLGFGGRSLSRDCGAPRVRILQAGFWPITAVFSLPGLHRHRFSGQRNPFGNALIKNSVKYLLIQALVPDLP